jgi:exodeoxyribonuclease III
MFARVKSYQRPNFRNIPGYRSYFSSSKVLKGYSGIGIYSSLEPENVQENFGDGKFQGEGRILRVDYGDFVLFNLYSPTGNDDLVHKFDFYEHFLKTMKKLLDDGRNVLVCGDFNIAHRKLDLVNPETACKRAGFLPEEQKILDRLMKCGYLDTFRMFNHDGDNYTWWSYSRGCREKNLGMRLDYFFASESLGENIQSAYIRHDIHGSDHCPVGLNILV